MCRRRFGRPTQLGLRHALMVVRVWVAARGCRQEPAPAAGHDIQACQEIEPELAGQPLAAYLARVPRGQRLWLRQLRTQPLHHMAASQASAMLLAPIPMRVEAEVTDRRSSALGHHPAAVGHHLAGVSALLQPLGRALRASASPPTTSSRRWAGAHCERCSRWTLFVSTSPPARRAARHNGMLDTRRSLPARRRGCSGAELHAEPGCEAAREGTGEERLHSEGAEMRSGQGVVGRATSVASSAATKPCACREVQPVQPGGRAASTCNLPVGPW